MKLEEYLEQHKNQEVRLKLNSNEYYKGILVSTMGAYVQLELGKQVFTYVYKPNIIKFGQEVVKPQGHEWSRGIS